MGRIKTRLVKRVTLEMYRENKEQFKKSFEENKSVVTGLLKVPSKKLKNIIAGYVTRLVKAQKE